MNGSEVGNFLLHSFLVANSKQFIEQSKLMLIQLHISTWMAVIRRKTGKCPMYTTRMNPNNSDKPETIRVSIDVFFFSTAIPLYNQNLQYWAGSLAVQHYQFHLHLYRLKELRQWLVFSVATPLPWKNLYNTGGPKNQCTVIEKNKNKLDNWNPQMMAKFSD